MNKKEFLDQFRSQFGENKSYYNCLLTFKKIRQCTGLDQIATETDDFVQLCKKHDILITGAIVENPPSERNEEGTTHDECMALIGLKELLDMDKEQDFYHPFWQLNNPRDYLNHPTLMYSRMFNMKTTPVLLLTEKTLEKIPEIQPEVKKSFKPFFVSMKDLMFLSQETHHGLCLSCNVEGFPIDDASTCPYCGSDGVINRSSDFPLAGLNYELLKKHAEKLWPEKMED
jgi:hypothetical protein